MTRRSYRRVWAIGIDGGTYDVIRPMVSAGLLPNIAALMLPNQHAVLKSTTPPWTPAAWTSFLTGVEPGEHGVFYFHQNSSDPRQFRLLDSRDCAVPRLWEVLQEQGVSGAYINIPMTFPPPSHVEGVLVSGLGTPDGSEYTTPRAAKSHIRSLLQRRDLIEPGIRSQVNSGDYEGIRASVMGFLADQIAVFRDAISHPSHRLVMVNFRATDTLQHFFWHLAHPEQFDSPGARPSAYKSVISDAYSAIDSVIGEARAMSDPDTAIVVFSDHGFGPVGQRLVYLNNWLCEHGWLSFTKAGFKDRLVARHSPVGRLVQYARKVAPEYARVLAEKWFSRAVVSVVPSDRLRIDWTRTRAYVDEYQETVWLNVVGRQDNGIVQPEHYEAVRAQLINQLSALRWRESGTPVFGRVSPREAVYSGERIGLAGDVVLEPNYRDYVQMRPSHYASSERQVFGHLSLANLEPVERVTGVHRPEGIVMSNVPLDPLPARISELTRVVLDLLGVEVSPGVQKASQPDYVYSAREARDLEDRLRGLGYLD